MSKINNVSTFQRQRFNQEGFVEITNGDPTIPEEFISIMCLADATGIIATNLNGDNLSGLSLKAGMVIYGKFTNIQVATGRIVAYYA